MYLSVVIPAYNEEKRIGSTLKSIDEYLRRQSYGPFDKTQGHPERSRTDDYEILVVSDGSKDNTADLVNGLRSEIVGLRLIDNKENHGKGYVVKQGMLEAKGGLRLFTDADNSTAIDYLDKFIPYINQGYSVVIGSIGISGHKVASGSEPVWRRILGKLGNLFIQTIAVPGIQDTQRGFKLFTADAVNKVFPRLTITRWGFDIEVLALARKFSYKIKELPVDWKNDPNSKVGLKAYFQVLLETIKIRWNLITGVYNK